jgi:DNA-binding FrmR family transcriptional regulator
MIAEGRATTDVLTQFKAVKSALEAVEQNVVQQALREGIERALQAPQRDEAARRLESLFHIHASVSANDVASGAQAPTHLDL